MAYDEKLRNKVIKDVLKGMKTLMVAAKYNLSQTTVIRWVALYRAKNG